MDTFIRSHWDRIYEKNKTASASWFQPVPKTSLDLIRLCAPAQDSPIIDIGGGDSLLVDHLLRQGFTDLTVLDISGKSLERAKARLGEKADMVTWIESDIREFEPERHYALWHDRAAFHFLTDEANVQRYASLVNDHVDGKLVIGTFSPEGPDKCSGLPVKQYSESSLAAVFAPEFQPLQCLRVDHITPGEARQNFVFCIFGRRPEIP